jgi:hypothetical protein
MAKRDVSIDNIAAEVGRFFGSTEKHARAWLEQRQELLKALGTVRDRATALMTELGGERPFPWRKRGRKRKAGIPVVQPGMRPSRKKRVMSEATRAKMRAAAKARWAEIKKKTKKVTE